MQRPELEILIQRSAEYLNAPAILHGHTCRIEIYQILRIFNPYIDKCTCMRDIELPAETQSADFAEIVFPDEMIRYIMVEQIRSLCIMEFAITGYGDRNRRRA